MAAPDEQLVRSITEKVMAQVQAQISGMKEKISKLEEKVETETNKRVVLEEEIRKLREQQPTQKVFLKSYAFANGEKAPESNGFTNGDRMKKHILYIISFF